MKQGELAVDVTAATLTRGRGDAAFHLQVPSLRLLRGECVAVTGASGCGKSTLLDLLGLIRRPDTVDAFAFRDASGAIVDVARLWRRGRLDELAALRASQIGYVLQTGGLLPFLPARDNIHLSLRILGKRDAGTVDELVERLAIGSLMGKRPDALSIGERQRVAIARALAHRPALLLADEPTAALDPFQGAEVIDLLLELVEALQMSAVIVSHDWNLMRSRSLTELSPQTQRTMHGSASSFVHP